MIPRAFGFRVVTSSRENAGDDVRVHFNQFICGNESRLNLGHAFAHPPDNSLWFIFIFHRLLT